MHNDQFQDDICVSVTNKPDAQHLWLASLLSHYIGNKGSKPVIIWVPSHVGIEGNEIADQIANDMVNAEYIEPIAKPKPIILGNIWKLGIFNMCGINHYK